MQAVAVSHRDQRVPRRARGSGRARARVGHRPPATRRAPYPPAPPIEEAPWLEPMPDAWLAGVVERSGRALHAARERRARVRRGAAGAVARAARGAALARRGRLVRRGDRRGARPSVAAANSALHRARDAVDEKLGGRVPTRSPRRRGRRALLARYVRASTRRRSRRDRRAVPRRHAHDDAAVADVDRRARRQRGLLPRMFGESEPGQFRHRHIAPTDSMCSRSTARRRERAGGAQCDSADHDARRRGGDRGSLHDARDVRPVDVPASLPPTGAIAARTT